MSTSMSGPPAEKKISSWVRPRARAGGARARRAGSAEPAVAAATNRHSAANSLRPALISAALNREMDIGGQTFRRPRLAARATLSRGVARASLAGAKLGRKDRASWRHLPLHGGGK